MRLTETPAPLKTCSSISAAAIVGSVGTGLLPWTLDHIPKPHAIVLLEPLFHSGFLATTTSTPSIYISTGINRPPPLPHLQGAHHGHTRDGERQSPVSAEFGPQTIFTAMA